MKTIPVRAQTAVSQRSPAPLESLLTLLILLTTLGQQAEAQSPADEAKSFDIPAQSLESALIEWSRQADVQVMVAGDVLKGHKTQPLKGTLGTRVALATLLKDTGLEAKFAEADNTVTVTRDESVGDAPESRSQASSQGPPSQPPAPAQRPDSDKDTATRQQAPREGTDVRPLEEVVVTGTHVRGATPVGSPLVAIERADIDRLGYPSVVEVLRTVTQNFGGGSNEGTRIGGGPNVNVSAGSSVNLRGLGPGSTLVLLNGRRLPAAGSDASFVDLSKIPLTAIERIEVLPDGASAIYGADAVAGVVNIVLRSDYEGAETQGQMTAPTQGSADGLQLAQILGTRWSRGRVLGSYEYYERDSLPARDRDSSASMDLRPFGGSDFRSVFSNPGTLAIGSQTWAIPSGQDGRTLDAAMLVPGTQNRGDQNAVREILPEHKRHSAVVAVEQALGEKFRLSLEALYSDRNTLSVGPGFPITLQVPNTNPFYVNPTGGSTPVSVRYDLIPDLGPITNEIDVRSYHAVVGLEVEAARDWSVSLHGTYAREETDSLALNLPVVSALTAALADPNPATAFNPFGDGSFTNPATLAAIRGTQVAEWDSDVGAATLIATGAVATLPAGKLSVAAGGEYWRTDFETLRQAAAGSSTFQATAADRNVRAGFAELRIPLFSELNARSGAKSLDVSLAARYERYSDFGNATSPKVGLTWSPWSNLALRGSWGRSFKAPTLPNLDESANQIFLFSFPDPLSSTGSSPALVPVGRNADLTEETATSWTAGLDFAPARLPESHFGLTYFDIEFDDRIQEPTFQFNILQDPALSDLVTRNPTPEQRAAICSRGQFFGTPDQCLNAPIAAIVDLRLRNTARTQQRGLDLATLYTRQTGYGELSMRVDATYLLELEQALLRSSPLRSIVNTPLNPVDFKLRTSLGWNSDGFAVSASVSYIDDYTDRVSIPNRTIGSWTTCDLHASYEFEEGTRGKLTEGVRISLTVLNAFDRDPPFFNNSGGIGYDPTNADVMGRAVSLQVRKKW